MEKKKKKPKPPSPVTAKVTLEWNWSENIYNEPQNDRCVLVVIISMAWFYSHLLQADLYSSKL